MRAGAWEPAKISRINTRSLGDYIKEIHIKLKTVDAFLLKRIPRYLLGIAAFALIAGFEEQPTVYSKIKAAATRNLGALAYLDNTQEALQAYRRATQLDPGNADGWNRLGHLLSRVGDLDAAIAAYNTVLALGEQHNEQQDIAAAYGNLGIVYQTRGDLDKAIEFHQKALKLNEDLGRKEGMANQYGNLGNVYKLKGNKTEAKRYYLMSIKLFKQIGSPNEKTVQTWLDALQ